jgi:hypothetical protein
LRRAIAGFDLIRFVTQVFPALLVNALHLQVAEEAAFLHRNPTGHGFLLRDARNPAFSILRQQLPLCSPDWSVNLRELRILPIRCRASSLARGSVFCVPQMAFLG